MSAAMASGDQICGPPSLTRLIVHCVLLLIWVVPGAALPARVESPRLPSTSA